MIEHRWSERIKADHEVLLITNNNDKIDGRLTNISLYGGYVEVAEALDKGTCLHICFNLPDQVQDSAAYISALVVHRSEQGIGLIINTSHKESLEQMRKLLRYYRIRQQSERLPKAPLRALG